MTEPLTDEDRKEILHQAKKPYGSVDEKYLRDWLLGALATIDARDKQLLATEVPAGCGHKTERRYRCYECDRTFCKPCIKQHCEAQEENCNRKQIRRLEWLVGEKDKRAKALWHGRGGCPDTWKIGDGKTNYCRFCRALALTVADAPEV